MSKSCAVVAFVTAAVFLLSFSQSECSKNSAGIARKEDIPFIRCQVCEKLVGQLHRQLQKKQTLISPKKVSEYDIIELVENVCNLKKEEADWILKIDILEKGDKLELVDQEEEGHCSSKCKTIERACQEVMGYSDTDLAEYVYNTKPTMEHLFNFFCKDLAKVCNTIPPPLPKDRTPLEPFIPKSSKEAEMDKLLKSVEGMPGAGNMKMYSREDLMSMKNLKDEDGEDDDGDEDDDKFSSNLGKVLREKEVEGDWKERVKRGITGTVNALRQHVDKLSSRLQKWWDGGRATEPNSKKKNSEF